ncbi:SH3 domain-containing protein [Streptomyces vinaceus]|uniref:SH3 domain-containing protein n=1 Tax=Streptomyces vinaceus TaxID=1960 RepID=UPI0035E06679
MRRTLIPTTALLALAALPVLGAPAMAAQAVAPTAAAAWNSCGYHPSTNLKLRTGPSNRDAAVGLLTPKDSVQILQERAGFYQVELAGDSETGLKWGTKGWVSKHLTPHVCMNLS